MNYGKGFNCMSRTWVKMRWLLRLLLALCLLSAAAVGVAAGDLSVSVAEEERDVVIEVSAGGEPAENANVSVSGVDEPTEIDGDYVADSSGRVTFDSEDLGNLTGVVFLRITVEHEGSLRSTLTSVTRGPGFDDAGFGQRLSKTLSVNAAETQGSVEGYLKAEEARRPIGATNRAELLSTTVNDRLMLLGEARFEHQVVGTKFATGELEPPEYYVTSIHRSNQIAYLESYLPTVTRELAEVDEEAREREGVDEESLAELLNEVENPEEIDGDRRIR